MLFRWRLGDREKNINSNLFYLLLYFYFPSLSLSFPLEPKDQLTWNQKSALLILLRSQAKKQNFLLVLILFWPIIVSFQHLFTEICLAGLWCLQAHAQTICLLLLRHGMSPSRRFIMIHLNFQGFNLKG